MTVNFTPDQILAALHYATHISEPSGPHVNWTQAFDWACGTARNIMQKSYNPFRSAEDNLAHITKALRAGLATGPDYLDQSSIDGFKAGRQSIHRILDGHITTVLSTLDLAAKSAARISEQAKLLNA